MIVDTVVCPPADDGDTDEAEQAERADRGSCSNRTGPGTVLEGGCEKHMLNLLTQLIREVARTLTGGRGRRT